MNYIKKLEAAGFAVTLRSEQRDLPKCFLGRYTGIPLEYLTFLQQFESAVNGQGTSWFSSLEDFGDESDSDFVQTMPYKVVNPLDDGSQTRVHGICYA